MGLVGDFYVDSDESVRNQWQEVKKLFDAYGYVVSYGEPYWSSIRNERVGITYKHSPRTYKGIRPEHGTPWGCAVEVYQNHVVLVDEQTGSRQDRENRQVIIKPVEMPMVVTVDTNLRKPGETNTQTPRFAQLRRGSIHDRMK